MIATTHVTITGPDVPDSARVLTPEALALVHELDGLFAGRRCELLAARRARREALATGWTPGFDPETAHIREDPTWQVPPPAPGLLDRRVEITGPPDRRMAVNALNSGAQVWMADFEDALSPTWANLMAGQATLLDAVNDELAFTTPEGKAYAVGPDPATIVMRPRGWHLVDKHVLIVGRPVSASLLDVALFLTHCAHRQVERRSGPYLYLPKLESRHEARLWHDVFVAAEARLGLAPGTIRATVLVETVFAAFEMEEILFELGEHAAGLNAGRWDYLFSMIKAFGARGPEHVLPDRSAVTMTAPFMQAYTRLLVDTCHRRGAHAIGGMSAFVPSRDPAANAAALEQVRLDKKREASDGFDGSWVAHPGLVATCREVFDSRLGAASHQISVPATRADVSAVDLLDLSGVGGVVTMAGVRSNIAVALRYVDAWLRGSGAVALGGLMEDMATAEIARCQVWQWLRHATPLDEGGVVDRALVLRLIEEETAAARRDVGVASRAADARRVVEAVTLAVPLEPFLTCWAYPRYLVG